MTVTQLLFSPKGRISAPRFWAGFGILSAISIGVLFVPIVGGFLWLATFVPWTLLTTKRLHDMGRSGWFQLVAYGVNLVIVLIATGLMGYAVFLTLLADNIVQATLDAGSAAGATATLMLSAGLLLFNTVWLMWLGGSPGTPDENRYGRPTHWG